MSDLISRQAVLNLKQTFTDNAGYETEYVDVEDIKELPSIPSAENKGEWISIDDVMSVFDDFMCGEVDEEGTATFLEMLKDKAESEE